jgi:hypothetical protein
MMTTTMMTTRMVMRMSSKRSSGTDRDKSHSVSDRRAIFPHHLPEPIAGHRVDYWTWVENHADTTKRDNLLALRNHRRDSNIGFFEGIMLEPYITLTSPCTPQRYGECCPLSSWGSRLEIRLRPSLLDGTHPHVACGPTFAAGRMQFVKDILVHEMIHQHIMEHQPGVDEHSYHWHGPVFTEHCNRIGAQLGLPEVVVRNRNGTHLPKAAQWPHCVVPASRYEGAYAATDSTRRAVTDRCDIARVVSEIASRFEHPTGKDVMVSVPKDDAVPYMSTLRKVAKFFEQQASGTDR